MKELSVNKMVETIITKRKELKISQAKLAERTSMHRSMIIRLEKKDYIPSIPQLQAIAEVLDIDITEFFIEKNCQSLFTPPETNFKIVIVGTGYVGLSVGILLAQHNMNAA